MIFRCHQLLITEKRNSIGIERCVYNLVLVSAIDGKVCHNNRFGWRLPPPPRLESFGSATDSNDSIMAYCISGPHRRTAFSRGHIGRSRGGPVSLFSPRPKFSQFHFLGENLAKKSHVGAPYRVVAPSTGYSGFSWYFLYGYMKYSTTHSTIFFLIKIWTETILSDVF